MSSNLKVNTILPSVGSNIGIGTNGGELNVDGGCKVQVGTALTLGHSIGLQYATQNLHSEGFEINQINASGIITATSLITNGSGGINISASGSDLTMNSAGAIFTGNGGNATDPIVANGSDTNTGYFYPAADTLAFTTGGSERLRIDSSGRVIIGDTNTNNAFSGGDSLVIGNTSSGTRSGITLVSNSSTDGGIYFSTGSSNKTMGQIVYNHPDNSLRFYANNSQNFRVKSDGQLDLKRGRVNDAGHMVYRVGGRIAGTATVSLDIPVLNDGNIYWIEAFYTHHSLAYGGYLYGVYGAYSGHNGLQINNTIGSSTAGGANVGTWSVSRGNAGTPVVVAKSAGSYGGYGYYWIHVHAGTVPNL